MSRALWIVQGLLSFLFIFGGAVKLTMPIEEMLAQMPVALPGLFLQFIGVAEVLGGLGLILPGLLRIRTELVPLAAAGLTVIMVGAVGISLLMGDLVAPLFPLVVGLLTGLVAYTRWSVVPHGRPSRRHLATA